MEDKVIRNIIDSVGPEDISKGYIYDGEKEIYICLFCGEIYEEGVIYKDKDKLFTAKKAIKAHIVNKHESTFKALLEMDKKYTGLSQKELDFLELYYQGYDNDSMAEILDLSKSTIRSYKFNLKEKKRQAKVFLSIMDLIERDQTDREKLMANIGDVAVYEKIKSIEKELSHETIEESLKDKNKFNLNFMMPFLGPNKSNIK